MTPNHKRPLVPRVGFGVLMLQALSLPWTLTSALRPMDEPAWSLGLLLAADLGALAALGLISYGRQTHNARARWAPAAVVSPIWVVIALLAPFQLGAAPSAALYSLFALVVAALSAVPFLTVDAGTLFKSAQARQASASHPADPIA